MPDTLEGRVREESQTSQDPLPLSKSDQIQKWADLLASQYREVSSPHLGASSPKEGGFLGGLDLGFYGNWLGEAHSTIRKASKQDRLLGTAEEWILDNYYIIRRAILQITEDMPANFYRQLPRLSAGPGAGFPRIFAISREILTLQNQSFNGLDLKEILSKVQENMPLTMGELWGLPIFLRYNLILTLAHVTEKVLPAETLPDLPSVPFPEMADNSGAEGASPNNLDRAAANGTVANIILSLRAISEQDWNDFFESVSLVEQALRKDPAGVYPLMDFKTRDQYRKEIEQLSFSSRLAESAIAGSALQLAAEHPHEKMGRPGEAGNQRSYADEQGHVGYYLRGEGRPELEDRIGFSPDRTTRLKRWEMQHANILYLGSIFLCSGIILSLIVSGFRPLIQLQTGPLLHRILTFGLAALFVIPVILVATSLINWLTAFLLPPRILPKLNFKDEIPEAFQTLVVVPSLISTRAEIEALANQVEMHYLRNPQPGLFFALLTDYPDADTQTLPEDESLLAYAAAVIEGLNEKYKRVSSESKHPQNQRLFFLLHRKRLWNPSEGKWMGWERKRGKLHELNLLLRGGQNLSFVNITAGSRAISVLKKTRFVITLDADTILPNGTAWRLVGTMAHPLNRARFDDASGRVLSGYSVLQPRMEINPRSMNHSRFTRIFSGDAGLDLYTLAVSDTYQDLFGEGSYVGKGIYDIDAFERSVGGRIPENSVLSHDLLEGLMGRAGLVTDITMIEDYPPDYWTQVKRQQRWIRGDWQLLPWLIDPRKFGVRFSFIDRWKMLDNLLRALLAPDLLLIYVLGMIFSPGWVGLWTATLLLALGIPLITSLGRSILQTLVGEGLESAFHSIRWSLLRWGLAVAFLPFEAYSVLEAVLTTLYRLLVTRRHLLQWVTAAQTARLLGLRAQRHTAWLKMAASTWAVLILLAAVRFITPDNAGGIAPALGLALPLGLAWAVAPLLAGWVNRPISQRAGPLRAEQIELFRQIARSTWGFFVRFVGPDDHWLPPDHYQQAPVGIVAHHTSPTNIGLLLTSTLAAYDLGYLDQLELVTRLASTLETFEQLERYRGHFLNWYDTLTLQPLKPRYVSTVDSGNLAASLIVTSQACQSLPGDRVFRWEIWQAYLDMLANLAKSLEKFQRSEQKSQIADILHWIAEMRRQILGDQDEPAHWYALFQIVSGTHWVGISDRLIELVKAGQPAFDLATLRELQEITAQVERLHTAIRRAFDELAPWMALLDQIPEFFLRAEAARDLAVLREDLPYNPALDRIQNCVTSGLKDAGVLRKRIQADPLSSDSSESAAEEALNWLDRMEAAFERAGENAERLVGQYQSVASLSEKYVSEMDFSFLYHPDKRVFHNGFNLDVGQLDNNCYDLLASEARIASIVALAKGEVPQTHWLQLNRPITRVDGRFALLSWSATMFEYLMPPLFLHSYPGTLLADSMEGVIQYQIAYGKSKNVPWGISESGFYQFDADKNYQYRAFGVPGLGFKRGLGEDLVIAPYASLMAIGQAPVEVLDNLNELLKYKSYGLYGFYEAIDFTAERLPLGETSAVVTEYMAHHQGMVLMAMANYFKKDVMVQRMHHDPRIQSVELLLQEQLPWSVPLQDPTAIEVQGTPRLIAQPVKVSPWSVPVQTAIPQVNLLSNGSFHVLISNTGSGYSTWNEFDLTRWQADGVLDPWGTWIYIREMDPASGGDPLWSAGSHPLPGDAGNYQVTFFPHMATYRRIENEITSTMEVMVCPEDPVEIRRIHLYNASERSRRLQVTSYGEVILTRQASDSRHPAFNKMFIESDFIPELNLQLFTRRPRSGDEPPIYLGHMLVVENQGEKSKGKTAPYHETDRYRFIGRGRTPKNPAALSSPQARSGEPGPTLDPIFALGMEMDIQPHQNLALAYLTFAGDSREAVIALARQYTSGSIIDRAFHQADIAAQTWLGKQKYDSQRFKDTLQVLSALLYPLKEVRVSPDILAANRLGQSGLWRFGISGDYPILTVELDDPAQIDLIHEVLQIYPYFRSRRFLVDFVILNNQRSNYGAELNGLIYRAITHLHCDPWLNQRGGIFILHADQMSPDERILLQTASRFHFKGERGTFDAHMPAFPIQIHHLPELFPTRSPENTPESQPEETLPPIEPLKFPNGYGGFSQDGREYIIELSPDQHTPAPWINVIGYPGFGFMVSESGSQTTWAMNSGENRLTPWSNDPVRDPSGEALYLRDEESGEVWTPTPLPAGANRPYRVRHGAGYTIFEHQSHGLRQQLTLFASPEDPVKIVHLRIENTWDRARRITATQYIEWVLGISHAASMPYIVSEYDATEGCLLAANPYQSEFGKRVAFLIANKQIHGLTADRTEFLGRGGDPARPAALRRIGLETRLTPGEDACAVLQLHLDLLPAATEEIYFVLGEGSDKEQALQLARKYHDPAYVGAAFEQTQAFWDQLLGAVQVRTPDPAVDLMLNRWLLYQSLSCRVWARSAFYQPSGAFGFRDQLQDVLALLPIDPAITRGQILNAAMRQFSDGDVLHWWHPPSGRGVRTRISDDLVWLPYGVALYIEATGDFEILAEKIPFLEAPPLKKDELERYQEYPQSREGYPLLEHCHRAIQKGATRGPHGFPLIGTGDWNDGFNRVGLEGKGESVWLAWFLIDTLERFAGICDHKGESLTANHYRELAGAYRTALDRSGWDGGWYRRAYYDDGAPLGSSQNSECQIDAIAQSWSVLSGAGEAGRSRQAMQAVYDRLVIPKERLSLLFTPPFDKVGRDPGYIKGHLPGIRENGGQYTHAAIWTAWAFAQMGEGPKASELFNYLNPIYHSDTQEKSNVYRVEPYVMCADIYSQPPLLHRGGWTWYTGSAAWMYRLGLTALLGFKKNAGTLKIEPVIPADWDGFEIEYQVGRSCYSIRVSKGKTGLKAQVVKLDGKNLKDGAIPLIDDGQPHQVEVELADLKGTETKKD